MTFASLFTGGGLADVGAAMAGLKPIWGVEYDAKIAESYHANIGNHVTVADVCDVDPADFETPDDLHVSPPCTSASVANTNKGETPRDVQMAFAVCRFITYHKPRYFTLENVEGYRKYQSMALIRKCLWDLGYWHEESVLNAADYGVPQTRRRLILRASRDGFLTPMQTAGRWIGWYEAIADILHTCPESKLADWQLKRLPKELTESFLHGNGTRSLPQPANSPADTITSNSNQTGVRAVLIDGVTKNFSNEICSMLPGTPVVTVTASYEKRPLRAILVNQSNASRDMSIFPNETPAFTVPSSASKGYAKAILIEGDAAGDRPPTIYPADSPAMTIKTSGGGRVHRALLENCKVVAMTPRCLARFQSLPDWYVLPEKKTLACTVIGNGLPSKLYEAIASTFI